MRTLIISGGNIDAEFATKLMADINFSTIMGVDSGLEFLKQQHIMPTHIIGDFDSISTDTYTFFKNNLSCICKELIPEKDETDTQAALQWALNLKSTEIWILGATGSRIDHLLGNIQILQLAIRQNVTCFIVDSHNKICLLDKGIKLKKSEQFGHFVSLVSLTNQVEGLTLKGFKYPLNKHTLTNDNALGISNEILDDEAEIIFENGILIMIQSND